MIRGTIKTENIIIYVTCVKISCISFMYSVVRATRLQGNIYKKINPVFSQKLLLTKFYHRSFSGPTYSKDEWNTTSGKKGIGFDIVDGLGYGYKSNNSPSFNKFNLINFQKKQDEDSVGTFTGTIILGCVVFGGLYYLDYSLSHPK
jgi:hypothetical protein